MTAVVGTAGHIDHGKTTLLRALTGIDADRLPEEKRRGMTIDVGYAHLALDDGTAIDFVDVPGHDRLIGNMLVGVGEIDAALLVVAADDGPNAQTLEHLELLDAMGLTDGVVAVTKIDMVDTERVGAVTAEIRALIARTRLAAAPIVPVSGMTGVRLDSLRSTLGAVAAAVVTGRPAPGRSRLAIDRAFSVRGRGAVVTGTLRGASVTAGDVLLLQPLGLHVRVREVQVHGVPVERAGPGRTAINIAGVETSRLHRGDVLATPGSVKTSDRLLVVLHCPARLREADPRLPHDRDRVRLHLGTEQVEARVGRSGREAVVLADGRATAILRLERPIAVADGDRFVLRRPSPGATAAGGVVLDVAPPRGASRRRATAPRLEALSADGTASARLDLHGALTAPGSRPELAADVEAALAATAIETVAQRPPSEPDLALAELRTALARDLRRRVSIDLPAAATAAAGVIDGLVRDGRLERIEGRVRRPGRISAGPSPAVLTAMARLEALLDTPAPPPLRDAARSAGCPPDAVRILEREGRIVVLTADLAWSRSAWHRLVELALELAERRPLSPATLRDATGTSRKYVMALLEDLDRRGILARTPAGHIPGPRARAAKPELVR